ncbi:hypothetical protein F4774DRAFT_143184 [Daldinia eschscholtzii]|nr:hypothetical protein F4774DRAFT_143184 [Daldinia eschscholtzii]
MAADDSEANNTTMERINKLKSFLEDLDDSDEKRDENKRKFNDDVESLLQGQINSHTNDFLEETILHVAARKGIVWAAKILLEKEANALTTTSYGDTPFHMAAANGYTEMVELFLNENKPCPVNVTTRARWEMTALHRAAWDGRDETIEFLVRAGAEVDAKDIDGWTPLMAATQGRCLSSMEVLLDNGGHDQMNIPDNEGKTPLFVAIEDENLEGMHILLDYMPDKNKCDTDVYQRLLSYEASDLEDGRLDMQKCIQQTILDALEKDREAFDGALLWAAAKFERHEIAKTLLIRGRGTAEQQPLSESSVIELATQQRKLDILWWLVATSPRNSKIMANIKKAKDRAKSLKQAQETTTRDAHRESESRHKNKSKSGEDSGVTEAPTGINETSIRRHIIDILQYPPIAQEYEDSATLDPPRLKPQHSKSVNEFEATIAQFYNSKQISGITQRTRDLKDVIYGKGPKSIMADAISDLKKIMGKRFEDKEESPSSRRFRATYNEDDLAFTYIHLPATNMVWMKDLLLKVMADEKIEKGTARYHQASSFLQSTWFEIPDQISESRFMRPQFTERVQTASASKRQNEGSPPKRGGNQKGTTTNEVGQGQNVTKETEDSKPDPEDTNKKDVIKSKEQRDDNFIPSSALYMPFLSFATQEEERGGSGHVPWALTKLEQQLIILREDYKKSVVHSSATLDEAYYHFNLEDTPTVEERDRRNRNQVVTKQLDSEPKDPRQPRVEPWPLLRVNQIWIWTINDST